MHYRNVAASVLVAAGLGWAAMLSVSPAQALPAPAPASHTVTCPGGRDTRYVPDPRDTNAYFVCRDGVQTQHIACPPIAKLIFAQPPRCAPQSNHHMA